MFETRVDDFMVDMTDMIDDERVKADYANIKVCRVYE